MVHLLQKIVRVADTELALISRDGRFQQILGPGEHRLAPSLRSYGIERLDVSEGRIVSDALAVAYMVAPEAVRPHVLIADMGDGQVGLIREDGRLRFAVAPGERAFFARTLSDFTLEVVDTRETVDVDPRLLPALVNLNALNVRMALDHWIRHVQVDAEHVGLLYVDGVLQRELRPGRHAFWQVGRKVEVAIHDLRLQAQEVTGQDLLTRDRVAIRANLSAQYRIGEVRRLAAFTDNVRDFLHRQMQFALRQAVGTRTLEAVLADKQDLNTAMAAHLAPSMAEAGIRLEAIGVKDIILPGDVRELMNRVIEAEKTAQANVIRRREETAATRSLLNTARLMQDNPVLMRLKELEALEKVSEKIGQVVVGNGMEGVLTDLVRLRPPEA